MKGTQLFSVLMFLLSCNESAIKNNTETKVSEEKTIPKGIIVAADSMKIPDPLNDLYFSVKVITNEYSASGTYDIAVKYGHNDATEQITFPQGGSKKITPVIRKSNEPFSYVVGFHYGDDLMFYDYYKVDASKGQIKMKYLLAYSFQ